MEQRVEWAYCPVCMSGAELTASDFYERAADLFAIYTALSEQYRTVGGLRLSERIAMYHYMWHHARALGDYMINSRCN